MHDKRVMDLILMTFLEIVQSELSLDNKILQPMPYSQRFSRGYSLGTSCILKNEIKYNHRSTLFTYKHNGQLVHL